MGGLEIFMCISAASASFSISIILIAVVPLTIESSINITFFPLLIFYWDYVLILFLIV